MSIETKNSEASAWDRVREAITSKWPHINQSELQNCKGDVCELVKFVKGRVDASDDEVESVIGEFAPQESIVDRVTNAASETVHQVGESARFAYMRADECISNRPTESVVTSFVVGIILGATVTALWSASRPEPTAWDRIRHRSWN